MSAEERQELQREVEGLNRSRRDRLNKALKQGYGPLTALGAPPPPREQVRERQPSWGEYLESQERAAVAAHQFSAIERILKPSGDEPDLEGFLAPKRPGTGRVQTGALATPALPSFAKKITGTSDEAYIDARAAKAATAPEKSSRSRVAELQFERQLQERAAEERKEQERLQARGAVRSAAAAEALDDSRKREDPNEEVLDYRGIVKNMKKTDPDEYVRPQGVSREMFLTVLDTVMRKLTLRLVIREEPDHRWVVWSALQHTAQLLEEYTIGAWQRPVQSLSEEIADAAEKRLRENIPKEKLKPKNRLDAIRPVKENLATEGQEVQKGEDIGEVKAGADVPERDDDEEKGEEQNQEVEEKDSSEEDEEKERKRRRQDEKRKREEWRKKWRERKQRELEKGVPKCPSKSDSDDSDRSSRRGDAKDKEAAKEDNEENREAKHRATVWRQLNSGGVSTGRDVKRKYVGQLSDAALDARLRESTGSSNKNKLMSEAEIVKRLRGGKAVDKGQRKGDGKHVAKKKKRKKRDASSSSAAKKKKRDASPPSSSSS